MRKTIRLTGLGALALAGLLTIGCSDNKVKEDESQEPAAEVAVVEKDTGPVTPVQPIGSIPDADLGLEAFRAKCDEQLALASGRFDALKSHKGEKPFRAIMTSLDEMTIDSDNFGSWAYFVGAVHPNADMRMAGNECVQRFIGLNTEVGLSRKLFDLVSAMDMSEASNVEKYLVSKIVRDFQIAGVDRDEETRKKVKALIAESFSVGQEFNKNINEDVRYVTVTSVDELAGLPDDYIASHQPDENGEIRISTNYPDYFPVMTYAENDELRQALRLAFTNRGYPVNDAVLRRMLEVRYELANTLGFENYAEMVMTDKMIRNPEAAGMFIEQISRAVRPKALKEKQRLLDRYRLINPQAEKIMPWQRGYVSQLIRKEQYDVDAKEVREYFSYDQVRDGIFRLIQDLFSIEIRPWQTSVWHESVEAFEVYENGELLGQFYLDMHPRDGKYKHAAQMTLRRGIKGKQLPLGALMTNFPGGDGSPGLMEHGQVVTFLHEFGHLIHNMLSGTQEWHGISGMSMERDFVEAPSQMLEEWVWDYETLKSFARNQSGEVIPEDLVNKMRAARFFGESMGTAGQTYLAALSLGFYDRNPDEIDFDAMTEEIYNRYSVFEYEPGGHAYANFSHLNGYSAIYYTYQWSLAIATDLFSRFEKEGMRNKQTAMDYRKKVLGAAGSKPANEFVEDFLGRPFTIEAYEDWLSQGDSGK